MFKSVDPKRLLIWSAAMCLVTSIFLTDMPVAFKFLFVWLILISFCTYS